jgi:hypothetical protein
MLQIALPGGRFTAPLAEFLVEQVEYKKVNRDQWDAIYRWAHWVGGWVEQVEYKKVNRDQWGAIYRFTSGTPPPGIYTGASGGLGTAAAPRQRLELKLLGRGSGRPA